MSKIEPQPASVAGKMPSEEVLVDRFADALKANLKRARDKGKSGWDDPSWREECQYELLRHVGKGDPLDVAAYTAFCWHHGWSTCTNGHIEAEALLSPAEPHDVDGERVQKTHKLDAGKDGDAAADLVARLRVEAASWRREDAHVARDEDSQAAFADEAADQIEAQGRKIAELTEALRGICRAALPLGNVAFNIGQRASLTFTDHEREIITKAGRDLDEARRRTARLVDEEGRRG